MKKFLAIVMALSLVLAFAACGDKQETVTTTTVEETVVETGTEAPAAETVNIGNTITVPFAEMTVDEAAIADDIKTSIKTGNITYTSGPDSSADKEFVYIRGTIKNTGKEEIGYAEISGKVEIDGYSYELASPDFIESDGSSGFSLAPLMTYQYTLYAEVPNELVENFTSCVMNFGFEENFDNPTIYSDKEYVPAYNYTINITK